MDKTIIYQEYENADDFLTFGYADVANDKAYLDEVEATVIRANDFKDVAGDPNNMPIASYGGHNVGSLVQGVSYYYHFPSGEFGNMHAAKIEGVVVDDYPLTALQRFYVYPRGSSLSYIAIRLQSAAWDMWYKVVDNVNCLSSSFIGRKPLKDEWRIWSWSVINKYLFDNNFRSPTDFGESMHTLYDIKVVNPGTPRGYFRTTEWTQNEAYIRSPGREYEDTDNPGIIQLWPYKYGYVLPKNSVENYIEITAEIAAAYLAGTAKLIIPLQPKKVRHLFSGTLDGTRTEVPPLLLTLGINEDFSPQDGIPFGSFMTFPHNPDIQPKRIYGGLGTDLYLIEDVTAEEAVDGIPFDIWMPSIVPIAAAYPINEGAPDIYPIPFSENLMDINNYNDTVFLEGNKYVIGVFLNSYPDAEYSEECNVITIVSDPCFCNCCRTVAKQTVVDFPAGQEAARDDFTQIQVKIDEGCDSIHEFRNAS